MTPEGRVKAKVKSLLSGFSAYQHWPVQAGYGKPCLDCHGCHNGRYFAVETKAPGKRPTPRQEITIEEIQEAGGATFVIGLYKTNDSKFPYSGMKELYEWLNDSNQ